VWQPVRRKTGEPRNFWYHRAAGINFQQVAESEWCLTLRPERHLTRDSVTPLPAEEIGRRVTKLKARMFNDLYLTEIHFWREFLAQGSRDIIINLGCQSIVIRSEFINFNVTWPGIDGADKPYTNQVHEEDLLSLAERDSAVNGAELDWNEVADAQEDEEGEY
jgi:hypothetical protein